MRPMNVLVIDGQGGGLGKQLVAALSTQCPEIRLTAVGTSLPPCILRQTVAPHRSEPYPRSLRAQTCHSSFANTPALPTAYEHSHTPHQP